MDGDAKRRMTWVNMFLETGNAGLTCRRCGISRPTLRKWVRAYEDRGEDGLKSKSSRPLRNPSRKINDETRATILKLRHEKNIGARRIQIKMGLSQEHWISRTIIQRTLDRAKVKPLKRPRRPAQPLRYNRPVPGDRVQLGTMKIKAGMYQYTAVDDCSRFRVLGLYPRRSAKYILIFLERLIEEMPFPIQRIQTDRGTEFFAENVQNWLKENFIKFRPIPPRSPHLNGKVERSQLTDLQEFWAIHPQLSIQDSNEIEYWQFDYNWRRPHGSLNGKTPIERIVEVTDQIPDREVINQEYDETKEPLRFSSWATDRAM